MDNKNNYIQYLNLDKINSEYRAKIAWKLSDKNKNKLAIDIGCGKGYLLDILTSENLNAFGTDRDFSAIKHCKTKNHNVVLFDVENGHLPYLDETFDVVFCLEVLEHLYNPMNLLSEVKRILKKNGQLIISVPNPFSIFTRIHIFLGGNLSSPFTTGGHIKFFRFSDLKKIKDLLGFTKIKLIGTPYPTSEKKYGYLSTFLVSKFPTLFSTWFFAIYQTW